MKVREIDCRAPRSATLMVSCFIDEVREFDNLQRLRSVLKEVRHSEPFSQGARMWQTDGQTDRQTDCYYTSLWYLKHLTPVHRYLFTCFSHTSGSFESRKRKQWITNAGGGTSTVDYDPLHRCRRCRINQLIRWSICVPCVVSRHGSAVLSVQCRSHWLFGPDVQVIGLMDVNVC